MNKQEYRKHCEEQIERCIKLNDSKHLKEHELSLSLLNENEHLIESKNNLINYLEDKLMIINKMLVQEQNINKREWLLAKKFSYQDILERLDSGKYE